MKISSLLLAAFLALSGSAFADVFVLGSLVQDKVLMPGESFEGVLLLRNLGTDEAYVRIYQTDYLFYSDGRNTYGDPGTMPRSNATWISLSQDRIIIPPKSTVPLPYKGRIPTDMALNGTYWSAIMIEPLSVPALTPQGEQQPTVGVQTTIRFAVQVAIDIGNVAQANLKIIDKALVLKEGKTNLLVDVENAGGRKVVPVLSAELFDAAGKSVGKFPGGTWRIYPSCSVRFAVDLSSLAPGKYTALVVLDDGGDNVVGGQYVLELMP